MCSPGIKNEDPAGIRKSPNQVCVALLVFFDGHVTQEKVGFDFKYSIVSQDFQLLFFKSTY